MPPHAGHLHLIRTAAAQVDELAVMVCSVQKDPIAGSLRYYWLKEIFPKLRVIHVTDEKPQEPSASNFFWPMYKDTIERNCPDGVDIFFSSNHYGKELARQLNAVYIPIDSERKAFPISSAAVRNEPYKNWTFIPEVVRPYFIKKVVLSGPESVGKTVLAEKLAKHYHTNLVEEYGREYCEKVSNTDLTALDFAHIAAGQLLKEDEAARRSNKILFCDTDLIVTQIWAEVFIQNAPQWIYEINHQRKYDLFLLLQPDVPWVDDGTREYKAIRLWQFERLRQEFESRNLPYAIISGDFEERFRMSVERIDEYLGCKV